MVSLLHLAQCSHLIFEECHSQLCGVFGISRNSILFHEVDFLFRHIDKTKARSSHIEKLCSSEVIIAEYDGILGQ